MLILQFPYLLNLLMSDIWTRRRNGVNILLQPKSRDAISAASMENSGTGASPVTPSSTVDGSAGRQTRRFTRSSADPAMRWSPGKSKIDSLTGKNIE